MIGFSIIKSLTMGDFINVRRDSMLAMLSFVPIITALFARLAVPPLLDWLLATYGLDLTPYAHDFLGYFLAVITPTMFGAVIGFLLLDERDDDTLTALQVTPLPLNGYLVYRLGLPVLVSLLAAMLVFPLAGIRPPSWPVLVLIALLTALEAPLYALFLAAFSENKVAGLALMKGLSAVTILPIVAVFIPSSWQLVAGIIPTYWPLKMFWAAANHEPVWVYFLVGLAVHIGCLILLLKRFNQVMYR